MKKYLVPNSGDGVFALKNLPEKTIIAYYSLYLYKYYNEANIYFENCRLNQSRSLEERRECFKYQIPLMHYQAFISLPPEMDNGPCPNFGPKVNHHFQFNNSAFGEIEHPRWGVIVGVGTTKQIRAGEEIYSYYSYENQNNFKTDFPWYHDAYMKYKEKKKIPEQCYSNECGSV